MSTIEERQKAVDTAARAAGAGKNSTEYINLFATLFVDEEPHVIHDGEELTVWQAACMYARNAVPALSPYLSLFTPIYMPTVDTLGCDAKMRLIIGPWFFSTSLTPQVRATLLVHECMHCVLGHHDRPGLDATAVNLAGDAVINQAIVRQNTGVNALSMPRDDKGSIIGVLPKDIVSPSHPDGMADHLPFEAYYAAVMEAGRDGQGGGHGDTHGRGNQGGQGDAGGQGSQSGRNGRGGGHSQSDQNGQGDTNGQNGQSGHNAGGTRRGGMACHVPNAAESRAAENLAEGVDDDKVENAHRDAEMILEAQHSRRDAGTGSGDGTLDGLIAEGLKPSKVDWGTVFADCLGSSMDIVTTGRDDTTYSRPNRRFQSSGDLIVPGHIGYSPVILVGCDTSGSMSKDDYIEALSEIEALCRHQDGAKLRFVCVDTQITKDDVVSSAADVRLTGGGGTDMTPFYTFATGLAGEDRPDVTVLATDGGFSNWDELLGAMDLRGMRNIILITDRGGYDFAKRNVGTTDGCTVLPLFDM